MDIYELARGPLVWATLIVFLSATIFRMAILFRTKGGHRSIYPAQSMGHGIRALFHGLVPFASTYMRSHPVFAVVTFTFHLCLLLVPVFLLAHTVLWYESWEVIWWSLPDMLADVMTIWVILACVILMVRRRVDAAARQVTRRSDYILPMLVLLPFLTGFLAAHQWGPYRPMLILHILSGELLLVCIPFTRFAHMIYFFFARVYMGAEFGRFMKTADW